MSSARKQSLVRLGLALLTIWPAVQMGLCWHYDVSPWKLAGWGMYSTPRPKFVSMEIFGGSAEGREQKLTNPPPELRQQVAVFLERWRWLGNLARPDELARTAQRLHPEWRRVRVVAYKPELNLAVSRIELSETSFAYAGGQPESAPTIARSSSSTVTR